MGKKYTNKKQFTVIDKKTGESIESEDEVIKPRKKILPRRKKKKIKNAIRKMYKPDWSTVSGVMKDIDRQ